MKARTFGELQGLLKPLRRAQRETALAAERERALRERELRESNLFVLAVGDVIPLRASSDSALPDITARAPAQARQRERDEAAVMIDAISDAFDAETLLDTDDALSFRRSGIGPEVVRKLRRGVWTIQAQLDLHGARRDEARERLNRFVHEAGRNGLRCVRVIHGKGNGSPGRMPVLRSRVGGWLAQKKEVLAFTQARAADGGTGALLVLLGSADPAAATPPRSNTGR